jgi:dUTP pyrophosphatase
MKIRFIKFDKNVETPVRAHYSDTGADVKMPHCGLVGPHQTTVIPLGFGIEIPNGYSARLQIRTSIATKGIIVQGCAIDAGYTGELHAILHNMSNDTFSWSIGDKLCYIEVYPTVYPEFVENLGKERQTDRFGSTGK